MFTKDLNTANTIARALKAGTVWVNTWNQFDVGVPFGGYKQSGIGREKGGAVLDHYTQVTHHHLCLRHVISGAQLCAHWCCACWHLWCLIVSFCPSGHFSALFLGILESVSCLP